MVNEIDKKLRADFARNLIRLQIIKKVSNNDLAEALDVTRQMITRYRSGSDFPSHDRVHKMAKRLGVTVEDLLKKE